MMTNSPPVRGLPVGDAHSRRVACLAVHRHGVEKVTYRRRNWLFSRQRYWASRSQSCTASPSYSQRGAIF
jgi:leucyl-tRNA synthetase